MLVGPLGFDPPNILNIMSEKNGQGYMKLELLNQMMVCDF